MQIGISQCWTRGNKTKGSIKERSPGYFKIILDVKDASGKRRRKWHSFKGTKRQAQIECSRLITEMESGDYVEPSKMTLADFFERWLRHIKPNVSPRTHERYTHIALKNIVPLLGSKILSKLAPIDISEAYPKAIESGRRDGKGGLSPRTVHRLHREFVLRARSGRTVEDDQSQSGRTPRKARSAENRAQIGHNDRCADNRNGDGYRARAAAFHSPGARCGLRRGEITALRRKAIDLDTGQLAVIASTEQLGAGDKSKRIREKEAKSGKARTVKLPSLAIEELRRWRLAQAEELLKLGIRTDDSWHVVTAADGSTPQPRSPYPRRVQVPQGMGSYPAWAAAISHANHMLASNVHPKIMQERLGHSSIGITLDVYSHLMPNMHEGAAATVDGLLRAAINKRADDVG